MKKHLLLLLLLNSLLQSCYEESYIPVEAMFITEYKNADESVPVYIEVQNLSKGGDTYEWEFEGGTPATWSQKDPGDVFYEQPGTYTIKLTVSNVDGEKDVYEQQVEIKDAINISFTKEIIESNYPPVEVVLSNTTEGQDLTYEWTFENGIPSSFDGQQPPTVVFPTPGEHKIKLTVSNGFEAYSKTDTIQVLENIITAFDWETAYEDYDYQAPVKLYLENHTEYAVSYQWSFQGAIPSTSTSENPEVVYSQPGDYTITLTASNGKVTQTLQKEVTIHPNTGIYILENVKLGVNYAHNINSIGAFYSTKLRKSFMANEITSQNSSEIDIVFQGQNNNFTYNKFISPNEVNQYGFATLSNATETLFINSQDTFRNIWFGKLDFN